MIPPQHLAQCTRNLRFIGVSQQVKARAKTRTHIDELPVEQVNQPQIRGGCGSSAAELKVAEVRRDLSQRDFGTGIIKPLPLPL